MRLAPTNYVDLDYEPIGDDVAKQLEILKTQKCVECGVVISNFSGEHVIGKGMGRKLVCGLCVSQLEVKGWKLIASAKSIGRS